MARQRMISPSFWASEQVVRCSVQARLLWIGMWNFSDCGGVHPVSLVRLKMEVFPGDGFTVDQVSDWVDELIAVGLVATYSRAGKEYWYCPGWSRWQKISHPVFEHPGSEEIWKAAKDRAQNSGMDTGSSGVNSGIAPTSNRHDSGIRGTQEGSIPPMTGSVPPQSNQIKSNQTSRSIDRYDFLNIDLDKLEQIAVSVTDKIPFTSERDQKFLQRVCILTYFGRITKAQVRESLESAIGPKVRNRIACFRSELGKKIEPSGLTLKAIDQWEVPPLPVSEASP